MSGPVRSARNGIVSLCFVLLTIALGYGIERANFIAFIAAYAVFFGLYAWVITRTGWSVDQRRWWVGLGIGLRVVLLFSLPNLSDDFYRFLWDGRLAAQGVHPFAHTPSYVMANLPPLPGITAELYRQLNSPEYYTVYPPLCQGVFWLAAKLFPESLNGGVFVLKLFLLLCEVATLAMLALNAPRPFPPAAVWYALNPLVLLEVMGNGHFEGALFCFLLAGLFALQRGRLLPAALFWALSVATKLVPLLFLPIIWVKLGWRKGLAFVLLLGGILALLFLPLIRWETVVHMAGSLQLYFRQFAFNASGYYLLKFMGKAVAPPTADVGRTLGPVLGLVVFAGVCAIALFRKRKEIHGTAASADWHTPLLMAITLYLALATTVHPWYILLPFGLSLGTAWRFPLVWTAAAALSYSHYAGGGYQEKYALIALEYLLVAVAFGMDWRRQRQPLELSPTK